MKYSAFAPLYMYCLLLLTSVVASSVQANDEEYANACLKGKLTDVLYLMSANPVNARLFNVHTPLRPGLEGNNSLEMFNRYRGEYGVYIPAFIYAVSGGDKQVVDAFVRSRAVIDSYSVLKKTEEHGFVTRKELKYWTPLYEAVRVGHRDLINRFLEYGALLGSFDIRADTLFHLAARIGDTETIKILIQRKAPFTENFAGENAFHEAARYGRVKVFQTLLNDLASLNVRHERLRFFWDNPNSNMETPFFLAAKHGQTDIVSLLKTHGAICNRPNKQGLTPLQVAATNGHYQTVRELVENGAYDFDNVAMATINAVKNGHAGIVSYLMEINPNIDYQQAVIHAAKEGDMKMLMLLTEFRVQAPVIHINLLGTALYWVIKNGSVGSEGFENDSFKNDSFMAMNHLIALGAKLSVFDEKGNFPTHLAATAPPCVMAQLETHNDFAKVAAQANHDGLTALHLAARHGNTQVVQALLGKVGIDVNAKGSNNETPLYEAVEHGHMDVVHLLLMHNADTTIAKHLSYFKSENPIECAIRKKLPVSEVNVLLSHTPGGTGNLGITRRVQGVFSGQLPLFALPVTEKIVRQGEPVCFTSAAPFPTGSFGIYPVYSPSGKK